MPGNRLMNVIRKERTILAKKEGIEEEILVQAESSGQIEELEDVLKKRNLDDAKPILAQIAGYAPRDYVARVCIQDFYSGKILCRVGGAVTSLKPGTRELSGKVKYTHMLRVEAAPLARVESSFNVVWLGIEASGKSSLIERIRQGEFVPASLTIGLSVTSFFAEGVKLVNCDVSGHKSFRSIWDSLIVGNPDVMVYVIDASDNATLDEARDVLASFALKTDLLKGLPVLIAANKRDVKGALNAEQLTTKLNLPELMQGREWRVIETSAKTGSGIQNILEWVLEKIKAIKGVEFK
nr:ADP-ribosylation factor-like protein [Candidatus Njordarchaeota archaeon]